MSKEHKKKSLRLINQLKYLIDCARDQPGLETFINLEYLEAKADSLLRYIELEE